VSPDLLRMSLALVTWGVGEGMFFYFQPIYLKELGADPLLIGSILGAFGLAMTAAHIPAGYLADKIGRRPLLRLAWLSGLTAACLMAAASSLPLFVAGLLLYGLTAFVASPLASYVTAARGRWPVGRALTLISATFNLGMVFGPLLGGYLGDTFGLRTVYIAAAGMFVLSTLVVFTLKPQPRDEQDPDSPPLSLFSNVRYLGFLALVFCIMFALFLPQPLTPNFLQEARGLSLSRIGMLGSLGSLGNAVIALTLGLLNPRLAFLLAQAFVGMFALLIWRGEGLLAYGLAYFLLGGYRTSRPLAVAQARSLVHQSQMGLAYGMMETVIAFPIILAPPLAGLLYVRDPASVYPISLVLIAVSLLLTLAFAPRPARMRLVMDPE
jgi:predicted MFS family arabinose efflux permease